MPTGEKKGITVKVDAELYAEVKQYVEDHGSRENIYTFKKQP